MKYIIDFDAKTILPYDGVVVSPPVIPPVIPNPPLPPTPPVQPPPGWQVMINPMPNIQSSISQSGLFDVNQSAVWIYSVPPNIVHAHRIVAIPGRFPVNGVQLMTNQYNNNRNSRDVCISNTPGSMIPAGFGGFRQGTEGAYVFITLNNAQYGVVILEPNKEYWLNIKASQPDTPMDYLLSPQPM